VFATLSDRLAATFKNLRGKGRLSDADIDATAREIRIALLEADVALPVVKEFVAAVKERARGAEVSGALNPAQQIVKIVNDELVTILGGETRRLRFAKNPPTVIMLAGLQGAGKTTLAASSRSTASGPGSRCSPPSPATPRGSRTVATRSRWPARGSRRPAGPCMTWSSWTRPDASGWTPS
jgi:signal recognition particle subunit SRP54